MDLQGLSVLLDGYNLQLSQGTGIKTYGLSLIEALDSLGADVWVLFSRRIRTSSDPVLQEVLFFDNPPTRRFSLSHLSGTPAAGLTSIRGAMATEWSSAGRQVLMNRILDDSVWPVGILRHVSEAFAVAGSFVRGTRAKELPTAGRKVLFDRDVEAFIGHVGILNLRDCFRLANLRRKFFGSATQLSMPRQIDVWHATMPLPMRVKGAIQITTVHDLIPLRLPYTTLDDKRAFYANVKESLKHSTLIIVDSEHTKRDLLDFFDADSDRIQVIHLPVRMKAPAQDLRTVSGCLWKYGLTFGHYILFVSAVEPRKNVGRLIDAYNAIETRMPLVIVGKRTWGWESDLAGKRLDNVRLLEHVRGEDLAHLYTGAYCFVLPSLYEGFGLPALEAMACGCPVIVSDVSSLPEVCGSAALYVDPYDVADIKKKVEFLLNDPKARAGYAEAGLERAGLFSLDRYKKELHGAYVRALGMQRGV